LLTIHILNVGHGDSIIVEYNGNSGTVFGIIDSNRMDNDDPPALTKLRELGAQELSFVALTHPHKDHYKGLLEILEAYKGHIWNFYSFPLDHHKQGQLPKLVNIYRSLYENTDSKTIRSSLKEFVEILFHAKDSIGLNNWEEPEGFCYELAPVGFEGVEIAAILPPKKVKGTYFQMIEQGRYDIVNRQDENELSLAFSLRYKGKRIILGGDGTYSNWMYRRQVFSEHRGEVLKASVVKLPHHGSKENCHPSVIDYLFPAEGDKFACISANGRSHPHPDVFGTLEEREIKPFCTNLADQCGKRITDLLVFAPDIEPQFLRYLNSVLDEYTSGMTQPCQGDIKIQIDHSGVLAVTPEYDHPCPYRGGYDFLSSFI
jgi:beta-lactamase superfamily II metal-dependent hydrolase